MDTGRISTKGAENNKANDDGQHLTSLRDDIDKLYAYKKEGGRGHTTLEYRVDASI